MEDYDAIVSPLFQVARRKQMNDRLQNLELTDAQKGYIARLFTSPEYDTLLTLMEGEIIKAETEHFRNWKDRELFMHTGLVAVGQRLFFEHIQLQIKRQYEEIQAELDRKKFEAEISQLTPAEIIENSL